MFVRCALVLPCIGMAISAMAQTSVASDTVLGGCYAPPQPGWFPLVQPFDRTVTLTLDKTTVAPGEWITGTLEDLGASQCWVPGVTLAVPGSLFDQVLVTDVNGAPVSLYGIIPYAALRVRMHAREGASGSTALFASARLWHIPPTGAMQWFDAIFHLQTVTVAPAVSRFSLKLSFDGNSGAPITFQTQNFRAPTTVARLGARFSIDVSPLMADGTRGPQLSHTVSISDVEITTVKDPSISQKITTLFADSTLLQVGGAGQDVQHAFFAIHSGSATIGVRFSYSGRDYEVQVPIAVASCGNHSFIACEPNLGGQVSATQLVLDKKIADLADRSGIPPQLLKAQVMHESGFRANAYRYEPLSYDFRYHSRGLANIRRPLLPWLLAESTDCRTISNPGGLGTSSLGSPDVSPRQIYGVMTNQGVPLCRVMSLPNPLPQVAGISSQMNLVSMENVLYTNDACLYNNHCARWATVNAGSFNDFADYQVDNDPFSAQTVIAASYGLHQLMYETAVRMGYTTNGRGLPPSGLLDANTSLDLGAEYLAEQFENNSALSQGTYFADVESFLFQYGPALRDYNGPPALTTTQVVQKCGSGTSFVRDPDNPTAYDYPCPILNSTDTYGPNPGEIQ